MLEIIEYMDRQRVEWLFLIISALLGRGYRRLAKRFCPIYAKENVKRMYDAYHDLGGNDAATRLKDNLLSMPEKPEERED
ncbi:MAG: hypothetical protein LBN31_03420 [Hungatella sp.]|nr:hypothetical protein [Hungatella sp.]